MKNNALRLIRLGSSADISAGKEPPSCGRPFFARSIMVPITNLQLPYAIIGQAPLKYGKYRLSYRRFSLENSRGRSFPTAPRR